MNRNRYIDRIYLEQSPDSDHGRVRGSAPQGTERALALGTILASTCTEDFLEALISHLGALNEWGGEVYISAIRQRFDFDGNVVNHSEPGEYLTIGHVMHYGHRSKVKGQVHEPDTPLVSAETPEITDEEPASNGAEPEPVEA